ncbi:MAG: serine/threonine protein kinase, partial [Planctomycetes bacterium]|nr:serine/threonine protein kinase [Planctomycetota bacterium]
MKPSEVIESLLTRVAEARERGGTPDPQLLLSCYPGHEDLVQRTLARLETLTTVAHPERVLARMAEVPPTLSPDLTRFGPYEILGELGRGGQGQVYRARDTRLARQVALKVLTGYSAHSESALLRFRREAESASRLDDPGICTVFETGVHQGTPFIAMQLVEGRSLAQRNQRHWSRGADSELATPSGREELEDVLAMISQVARTIHRAHEAGLVHRDLKPGNIMLTDDDRAVVLDFGLAFDSESPDERLTMTGDQLGTPAYMAPEQIEARPGQVDRRADVYALGVTLYETLTGRRPFEGPTRQALYEAILRHDAVPPSRINTSLPRDLDVVILTALERDLDRRYQTALELGDELDRVAQREPIRARPAGPIFRSWRWAQRNPAVAASLAACLVVLTVGLATTTTLWQRSERSRRLADEERNRADASAAAARRHLDEYLRLSDAHMLEGFLREAEHLYPPHPELVGEMERWLLDAMNLADRLPAHQEELRRLRARAQRVPIEDAPSYSLGQAGRALLTVRSRLDEIESAVASGALDEERGRDLQRFAEAVAGSLPDLESARSAHYVYEFPELRDRWRASVLEWMISQLEVFVDPDPRR